MGCRGFGWLPALAASIAPADMRSSSASAIWDRALFPVHKNNTRADATARFVDGPGARVRAAALDAAHHLRSVAPPAGGEVDGVVAVAAVRRTMTGGHEPTIAELTQVVRHQALRLVDQLHQLPDGPIALHQLSQQPPPQRVRRQTHERRRVASSGTVCGGRLHTATVPQWQAIPIKPV